MKWWQPSIVTLTPTPSPSPQIEGSRGAFLESPGQRTVSHLDQNSTPAVTLAGEGAA